MLVFQKKVGLGGIPSIGSPVYDNKNLDISPPESSPTGLFVKPDGTKFWMAGGNTDIIHQYTMTGGDISTGSENAGNKVSVSSSPTGLFFKPDGMKMYMTDNTTDRVYQWTLNNAWDIHPATVTAGTSIDISGTDTSPNGLFISDDGTKMYIAGEVNKTIYQYTLLTPWDTSTASYGGKSFSVASELDGVESTDLEDLVFVGNGTRLIVAGSVGDYLYQYDLSTAWDINTASYNSIYANLSADPHTHQRAFSIVGSKLYTLKAGGDHINQYSI